MMKDYKVELINESLYATGVWKVSVELPEEYPFSSPSIAFSTKIYHPNIHFETGTVCVNVLNQTWRPLTDVVALLLHDRPAYEAKVKENSAEFAKPEDVGLVPEEESNDEEPSEDKNDSGDEAPATGSRDESMDVDPVN